jgi:hypothetical protein
MQASDDTPVELIRKRIFRRILAAALLVTGTTMFVWGWSRYSRDEQSAAGADEDAIRLCSPTMVDIAEELGLGLVARKLACLGVASVGMFLTTGSTLSLIMRKAPA